MKLLSLIIVAVCSINVAEATSVKRFSESNDLIVARAEGFNFFVPVGGDLTIDWLQNEVFLNIKTKSTCRGICPAVMPAPIQVELPIVKRMQDGCKAWHTIAKKDLRPVDGPLESVEIIDYSTNVCMYLIEVPGVEVKYKESFINRRTGQEIKKSVILTGTLH